LLGKSNPGDEAHASSEEGSTMKTLIRILSLSALVVFAAGFDGGCADNAALQKRINAEMAKYAAAFKAKDSKTCEAILRANFAKDYKTTDMQGKVTGLDHMIQQEKQHLGMIKSVNSMHLKVTDIKIKGDKATGKGSFHLEATVVGDDKNSNKFHKLHVASSWDANFIRKSGKWWVSSDKTTSEKVLIDGKPIGSK
jgi:hypothetical protein